MDTPIQPRRSIPTELKPRLKYVGSNKYGYALYFASWVEINKNRYALKPSNFLTIGDNFIPLRDGLVFMIKLKPLIC